MNGRPYRADIDGLRAVAVILVLLFHVGVWQLRGGFVGVDVFFVISGFLITRLILDDVDRGSFRFSAFYLRRLRRLAPALFVTILFSLLGAYVFVPKHLMADSGKSAFFAVLSAANFHFWKSSGYFDPRSGVRLFLQTWSLSVEEQFYLVWPALIVLVRKLAPRILLPIAIAFGVISLSVSQWLLAVDASAAFYLLPSRIFELGIGAVLVWVVRYPPPRAWIAEVLFVLGAAMILAAALTFTQGVGIPGVNVLLPCLGAALMVYSGEARLTGTLLRNRVAAFLGRISYSIYLVHWPLIVIVRIRRFGTLTTTDQIAIVVGSIFLAALLYRFVEQPVRRAVSGRSLVLIGALAVASLGAAAVIWLAGESLSRPWFARTPESIAIKRFKVQEQRARRHLSSQEICRVMNMSWCGDRARDVANALVIGDSHAVDALNALVVATEGRTNLLLSSVLGCPISDPVSRPAGTPECIQANADHFDPARYAGLSFVAVGSMYTASFTATDLAEYLEFVESLGIRKMIVFGNYLRLREELPTALLNGLPADKVISALAYNRYDDSEPIRQVAQAYGALFIDKRGVFCHRNVCKILDDDGVPFTWDQNHMSYEFGAALGAAIAREVQAYLAE